LIAAFEFLARDGQYVEFRAASDISYTACFVSDGTCSSFWKKAVVIITGEWNRMIPALLGVTAYKRLPMDIMQAVKILSS
jgi:hypothetical protein